MTCFYCDIAQKKKEAHILLEDENTVCFFDGEEKETHAIVISKNHIENIFQADEETWRALSEAARYTAQLLNKELGLDSLNIFHSSGPNAQQAVPHLAIHIVPRREGDSLDHLVELAKHRHEKKQKKTD